MTVTIKYYTIYKIQSDRFFNAITYVMKLYQQSQILTIDIDINHLIKTVF